MKKVVGIRFKPTGKIYDFDSGAFVLKSGDEVIVETEKGLAFGVVSVPPEMHDEDKLVKPLKKVFRLANEGDLQQREKNFAIETSAHDFCQKCIGELNLSMNLFSVESVFDSSKLTFFFTAEGRVDFRELVKKLVKEFRVRIEMRQVGIRSQAKMCGGVGRCGREICCSSFLGKFDPVSIRMAKEQSLSLNPTKISGLCGRLMCCLNFENDTYIKLKKKMPPLGTRVIIPGGKGKIIRHNVICNKVVVLLESGMEIETSADDTRRDDTKRDDTKRDDTKRDDTRKDDTERHE